MKKGVTPIVATVLLLVITIASASAAYVFFMSIQGKFMNQTQNGFFIDIQVVSCTNKTQTAVDMTIRNIGDTISAGDWILLMNDLSTIVSHSSVSKDTVISLTFEFNTTLPAGPQSVTINTPGGAEEVYTCSIG